MKIVSKFKDYYDSVGAYDREDTPLYIRKTEFIQNDKKEHNFPYIDNHLVMFSVCDQRTVALCYRTTPTFTDFSAGKQYYCSNPGKGDNKLLLKQDITNMSDEEFAVLTRDLPLRRMTRKDLLTCFESVFVHKKYIPENCPIWMLYGARSGTQIILNPNLSMFGYQKIKDSGTLYQELHSWLDNLSAPDDVSREPKGMTDKLKAETKGFDKWSFRRHKDDGQPKRRKHRVL